MKRDVKLEQFYHHPMDAVWKGLTDPALVGQWLMPMHGFKPKVGTRFQFRFPKASPGWNGVVDCEVLEVEPGRKLVYSWRGQGNDGEPTDFSKSTVAWTLEPTRTAGGGTVLRLEHAGFAGLKGVLLSFMMGMGWKKKLRDDLVDLVAGVAGGK
jgi:uncharacterized protein YndB with AHSA1/START domain